MGIFKVVKVDNYNRETYADRVVEENLPFIEADALCHALQNDPRRWDEDWFVVRPQTARDWRGMEELV